MRAKDIMTTQVFTVGPSATIREIAYLLSKKGISAVPVVDGHEVVGIVSEGDLIHRQELGSDDYRRRGSWYDIVEGEDAAAAFQAKAHGMCAREVMTRNVVSISGQISLAEIADIMERHNIKLQEKYQRIKENETAWEGYRLEDASIVLVSYGISSRIARSAVDAARKEGIKAGLFRPITLFPFPEKAVRDLAERDCKFISVEMSNGQMLEDVRLASGCREVELVCRYGGRLIELDAILEKIREVA